MKIVTLNANVARDLKDVVFKCVGLTATEEKKQTEIKEGNAKIICEEITLETDITGLDEAKLNLLMALLYVRINGGHLSISDITESGIEIITEEQVKDFFSCNFIKVCHTDAELSDYRNTVLANANTNAQDDIVANTVEWSRITPEGHNVIDVLTQNLCDRDWNIVDKMAAAFNLRNKVENIRTTKIQPMNMAFAQFGDQTVRTIVGSASEVAGNVASTTVNAITESAKSFAYSFSRDIKVGDILTDERAKSIMPNLREQGAKLGSLFNREKKSKRIGMR